MHEESFDNLEFIWDEIDGALQSVAISSSYEINYRFVAAITCLLLLVSIAFKY